MKTLSRISFAAALFVGSLFVAHTASAQSCCPKKKATASHSCCPSKATANTKAPSCREMAETKKQTEKLHAELEALKSDLKASDEFKFALETAEVKKCESGNEKCLHAMVTELQALENSLAAARNEQPEPFEVSDDPEQNVDYAIARIEAMRTKL